MGRRFVDGAVPAYRGGPISQGRCQFRRLPPGEGASPEKVQGLLVDRGVDSATASAAVRELSNRAIFSDAAEMLDAGAFSAKQVEGRLIDKGIEPQAAARAVAVLVAHAQEKRAKRPDGGSYDRFGAFVLWWAPPSSSET